MSIMKENPHVNFFIMIFS